MYARVAKTNVSPQLTDEEEDHQHQYKPAKKKSSTDIKPNEYKSDDGAAVEDNKKADDNMTTDDSQNEAEQIPYLWFPTNNNSRNTEYVRTLEQNFHNLQNSYLALNTRFARMQLCLRQILCAKSSERKTLLAELKECSLDDPRSSCELPQEQYDQNGLGEVEARQCSVIANLRGKLATITATMEADQEALQNIQEAKSTKEKPRKKKKVNTYAPPASPVSEKAEKIENKSSKSLKPASESKDNNLPKRSDSKILRIMTASTADLATGAASSLKPSPSPIKTGGTTSPTGSAAAAVTAPVATAASNKNLTTEPSESQLFVTKPPRESFGSGKLWDEKQNAVKASTASSIQSSPNESKSEPHMVTTYSSHHMWKAKDEEGASSSKSKESRINKNAAAMAATSSKLEPSQSKLKPSSSKLKSSSSKIISSLSKLKTSTSKLKTSTSKLQPSSSKVESSPSKVDSSPSKVESSPSKVESSPSKVESSRSKVESSPSKVESSRSKVESSPSKVESSPSKVESSPSKLKPSESVKQFQLPFPGNSRRSDSSPEPSVVVGKGKKKKRDRKPPRDPNIFY